VLIDGKRNCLVIFEAGSGNFDSFTEAFTLLSEGVEVVDFDHKKGMVGHRSGQSPVGKQKPLSPSTLMIDGKEWTWTRQHRQVPCLHHRPWPPGVL
jgi:hypothetical protein